MKQVCLKLKQIETRANSFFDLRANLFMIILALKILQKVTTFYTVMVILTREASRVEGHDILKIKYIGRYTLKKIIIFIISFSLSFNVLASDQPSPEQETTLVETGLKVVASGVTAAGGFFAAIGAGATAASTSPSLALTLASTAGTVLTVAGIVAIPTILIDDIFYDGKGQKAVVSFSRKKAKQVKDFVLDTVGASRIEEVGLVK